MHWLFWLTVAPERWMVVGLVVVNVPRQVLAELLATVSPAGSVSVKATPFSAVVFAAGLVMVNCSEVVAFSAMIVGLNARLSVGGAITLMVADAVPPVPPSTEVTLPVVLFWSPPAVPTTFTENVHDPEAASDAPDRLIKLVFCVSVIVPPPHVPVCPLGVAITRPAGSVSLKPMPVSAVPVFGLLIVKLSTAVPVTAILGAPNDLLMVGGATTVSTAVLLVVPAPPSVEVTLPVVLLLVPAVVPVTLTENVHDDPAAGDAVSVPPDRLMLPLAAVAVIVPLPQEPVTLGVAATTKPAGRLSVNATPLKGLKVFGLVMVKLSVLLLFSAMLVGLNDLPMVGGLTTARFAEAVLPVPPLVELTGPVVLVY